MAVNAWLSIILLICQQLPGISIRSATLMRVLAKATVRLTRHAVIEMWKDAFKTFLIIGVIIVVALIGFYKSRPVQQPQIDPTDKCEVALYSKTGSMDDRIAAIERDCKPEPR